MARTIKEIQDQIMGEVETSSVLSSKLTSSSKTAIYRLWAYIIASSTYIVEVFFDKHRSEIELLMANQHAHTLNWYRERALEFMYGKGLVPFTRHYDTAGMSPEEIKAARIVTYAACVRVRREGGRIYLLLKVAKGESELEPLTAAELDAFRDYLHSIQDAGVDIDCMSAPADKVRMRWKIYYNPQIIDGDGNRVDGSEQDVVGSAIKNYLKQMSFNGLYIPASHVDHLQAVDGIQVPILQKAELSADNGTTWAQSPDDGITPSAGWCKIYDQSDLVVETIPFKTGDNV